MDATGTAPTAKKGDGQGALRSIGLGLITGAADDDPSAIGTYAAAGTAFGPSFLWVAPFTLPMMYSVVYLSAKVGQVTGLGLFAVMKRQYPKLIYPLLLLVVVGNTFEAGADLGGMAAALSLLLPVPFHVTVGVMALAIVGMQIWGSYELISKVFRWLALTLFAYVAAAVLARPEIGPVMSGTLVPSIRFDKEFMAMLVAVVGTTLSAYLYSWKSNEEVEEKISAGLEQPAERRGTDDKTLHKVKKDVFTGMLFSNVIMYFIILSTAATLFKVGQHEVSSAAEAAQALRPVAGSLASILFAAGIVGVGFLAVPVMTAGAAYDVAQSFGWKQGLHRKPGEANKFHWTIVGLTTAAVGMNFLGWNPMKVLVWAGIVQGFSTPALMLLIMIMTNDRRIMGERTNSRGINFLGWTTTALMFAASLTLLVLWLV